MLIKNKISKTGVHILNSQEEITIRGEVLARPIILHNTAKTCSKMDRITSPKAQKVNQQNIKIKVKVLVEMKITSMLIMKKLLPDKLRLTFSERSWWKSSKMQERTTLS